VEFAARARGYTTFGIATGIAAAIAVFVQMMMAGDAPGGSVLIAMIFGGFLAWLLVLWPRMVRELVTDRRPELVAGAGRAPDRGLTAVGWLMLALGGTAFATQLVSLATGPVRATTGMFAFMQGGQGSELHRWLALLAGTTQVWAGFELVRMTSRARAAAVVFGLVGLSTAIIIHLEAFEHLDELGLEMTRLGTNQGAAMFLVAVLMSLVLPVTALVLALRRNAPLARVVSGG
jgi:hypothetical protein